MLYSESPQKLLALLSHDTDFQPKKGLEFSVQRKSPFITLSLRIGDPNSSLFLFTYIGTGFLFFFFLTYIFRIRKTVKILDQLFPWKKKKKIILKTLEAVNLSIYWERVFFSSRSVTINLYSSAYVWTLRPSFSGSKFSWGYLVTGEDAILKVMVQTRQK